MSSSVLKRKLEAKATVSAAIDDMSGIWADVSRSFLKAFNEASGRKFGKSGQSLGKIEFAKMLAHKSEHFPIFPLASRDLPMLGFIYFSQEASNLITDRKLGGTAELETEAPGDVAEPEAEAQATAPGLLDLLLLQPVAQAVLEQTTAAFASCDVDETITSAVICERVAALKDITGLEPETDLFHLVLTLQDEDSDTKAVVGLVLLYSVIEKASIRASQGKGSDLIDMSNPWQSHMYDVTVGTRVPLRVVLEECPMTVGECTRLEIGQTINLAGTSLEQLRVLAHTRDGVADIGTAALGVYKQNKAVKLLEDPNSNFLIDLADLSFR